MTKIKFFDLPNKIDSARLDFDGDKTDLRLHCSENIYWGATSKKKYNAACKAIDKINATGKGWQLYAWYDVSSYEYWMKQQHEQNYIQISISFDAECIDLSEVDELNNQLDIAISAAYEIAEQNTFNPMAEID